MSNNNVRSIENLSAEAESKFASGDFNGAAYWYRKLMQQAHVIDYEYDDWLRRLLFCYHETENRIAEGLIHLHMRENSRAKEKFIEAARSDLAAYACQAMGAWSDAAQHFQEATLSVHQALCLEKEGDHEKAAELWKAELSKINQKKHPYEFALYTYNVGRLLRASESTKEQGRRTVADSLRQIEVLANLLEEKGERERGFDCYLILVNVGKQTSQYENLAEGYLNCIRILKEDNLVLYALQYYQDFIDISLERKEYQAAATLLQEAAAYATKNSLPYGQYYLMKAGDAWVQTADQQLAESMSIDMVENSFVSALHCFNALEHWDKAEEILERCLRLGLSEEKTRRYSNLMTQLSKTPPRKKSKLQSPDKLKQGHAYAEIWIADAIEYELAGDPFQVAVTILKDLKYPDLIRRRALLIALIVLDSADEEDLHGNGTYEEIAHLLGDLQSYTSLKPLEVLLDSSNEAVRVAVMKSLRFLFFKRTFSLSRRGLQDDSENVKGVAIESLKNLNFQQALNPLTRIFFDFEDLRVKQSALLAIGKIQSLESVEFLLTQLQSESFGPLRDSVVRALEKVDNPDAGRIYQSFLAYESQSANQAVIEKLLSNMQIQ